MKIAKRRTGTTTTIPAGIGVGILMSIAVTLMGVACIAWLLNTERLPEERIGYAAMVVLALGTFAGSWTAVYRTKRLRLQVSLLSGSSYFLLLLAITALFFGGRYQGVGTWLIIIMIVSVAVAFLAGRKTEHRKHYR